MKKYNALATFALLLMTVFATATVYGLYESPEPWPMFKRDLDRTGFAVCTAPDTNTTLWMTSGIYSLSPPIVADGRVIAFSGGKIYAFDETTGAKLWESFTLTGTAQGIPAYSAGKVYAGTTSGYVYCVNATDGTKIWENQITSQQILTTTVDDGRVYVTTNDGYLYAIDTATGLPLPGWEYWTGGNPIYSWPAIHGDIMYFGCNDDKVRALNVSGTAGPSLLWQFVTSGNVRSTPCYGDGKIFIGSYYTDKSVFALNATTTNPAGEYIWKYTLDLSYSIETSPVYHNGIVYFAAGEKVYALNASALPGNYSESSLAIKKWSVTVGGSPTTVAVADGKVFVGTNNQKMYALNATTGMILWSYDFGSYSPSTPIVADGRVFVSEYNGIRCFGTDYPALIYYYTLTPPGHSYEVALVIHNATPSTTIDINRLTTEKKINYTIRTSIPSTWSTCNITVPNEMLGGPYTVKIDGAVVSHTLSNTTTHSSLYFAYFHTDKNAHVVEITGTTAVPEFPSTAFLAMLMVTSLAAAAIASRKKRI
ncbi:MAG: PQQ-binding-like beta-propeller repeat protein [Candidatus Bathyarchaeia archaeon]